MPRQTATKNITAADFTALLDRAEISDSDFMAITGTTIIGFEDFTSGRENLNMAEILLLELLAERSISSEYLVNIPSQSIEGGFRKIMGRRTIKRFDFTSIIGAPAWEVDRLMNGIIPMAKSEKILLKLVAVGYLDVEYLVNLSKRFTEIIDTGPSRAERRKHLQGGNHNGL